MQEIQSCFSILGHVYFLPVVPGMELNKVINPKQFQIWPGFTFELFLFHFENPVDLLFLQRFLASTVISEQSPSVDPTQVDEE